jgi:iron complex outermembrane recepter protein
VPPYQQVLSDESFSGLNVVGRLTRHRESGGELTLQGYFDHSTRVLTEFMDESQNTLDLDFMHRFNPGNSREVAWGFGYRITKEDIATPGNIQFATPSRTDHLLNVFVQDEERFSDGKVRLIGGSKLEHNSFTGVEVEPNLRVVWKVHPRHAVWGALSSAVRTPARAEVGIKYNRMVIPPGTYGPGTPATMIRFVGISGVVSEKLFAREVGYRWSPTPSVGLDVALYHNHYTSLKSYRMLAPFLEDPLTSPHMVQPIVGTPDSKGNTYGLETALEWRPCSRMRALLSYTFVHMHVYSDSLYGMTPAQRDSVLNDVSGMSPQHQVASSVCFDPTRHVGTDLTLRYVSRLKSVPVDGYLELDARLAWRPTPKVEVSVLGQNLLHDGHMEFGTTMLNTVPTQVRRSVYGKLAWSF